MKLILTLGLSTLAVASAQDCHDWEKDPKGLNYKGTQNAALTSSKYGQYRGKQATCQKWSSNYPNENDSDPNYTEDHNYCRNVDGDDDGPWCFLTDYTKTWYKNNLGKRVNYQGEMFIGHYGYCKDLIPQCGSQKAVRKNPSDCPKFNPKGKCFKALKAEKQFPLPYFTEEDNREWCKSQCSAAGYCFAATETPSKTPLGEKRVCKCFSGFDGKIKKTKYKKCNRWCTDWDQNKQCGGEKVMNVWKV